MINDYAPNGEGLEGIIRMNKIVESAFYFSCVCYWNVRHDLHYLSHSFTDYSYLSLYGITKHTVIKKYLVFLQSLGKIRFNFPNSLYYILLIFL